MPQRWRRAAREAARAYPALKAELEELRRTRITPGYDSTGRSVSGDQRPVENAIIRELPKKQMRQLRAVEDALSLTAELTGGRDRLRLIRLLYFSGGRYTLEGAALQVHVSTRTAQIWSDSFLVLVFGGLWTPGRSPGRSQYREASPALARTARAGDQSGGSRSTGGATWEAIRELITRAPRGNGENGDGDST